MTAPVREAVELSGRTADQVRALVNLVKAEWPAGLPLALLVEQGLPDLCAGLPPLVELCWKTPEHSVITNCDRRYGHGGDHSWAAPYAPPF